MGGIDSFFIKDNLNDNRYINLLQENNDAMITEIQEQDDNLIGEKLVLQHDRAHCIAPIREYINNRFSDRWIRQKAPKEWPPFSHDQQPFDSFLWGRTFKTIV